MNSEEIERILRRHVVDFDGVFSVDTLPDKSRLLVYNTEPSKNRVNTGCASVLKMVVVENFSIPLDIDLLQFSNAI